MNAKPHHIEVSHPDLDSTPEGRIIASWQIGASYFDVLRIDHDDHVNLIQSSSAVEGDLSATVDTMIDALSDYAHSTGR